MRREAEIPCSTCLLWNPEKKSFACDPHSCKKLSNWLLKHATNAIVEPQDKIVQYVV